jgi:RNA polymerase sigma-54 factor
MAFEMKQGLKQSQQMLLSPQIQQAIKILLLSRQELDTLVAEEIRDNPTLEEVDSNVETPEQTGLGDDLSQTSPDGFEQLEAQLGESDGSHDIRGLDEILGRFSEALAPAEERNRESEEVRDNPGYELVDVSRSTLHEDLEEQISMMHITPYERECALLLLQYVNDIGYIDESLRSVSAEHGISVADLEYALGLVQSCEPAGVGARDLRECLTLQMRNIKSVPALVKEMFEKCWPEFEKQDVAKIARSLKEKPEDIKSALAYIRGHFDPRPARQYGGDTNIPIVPDVYAFRRDGKWQVSVNEEGLPRLRVAPKYQNLIAEIASEKQEVESGGAKAKSFLVERVKNAKWILRAISERNRTILRVCEVILDKQEEFFDHGIENLKPLTLKTVSEVLGLHESTISRATTNKYIQCPRGIFELKFFFKAGLGDDDQGPSNETVKTWVGEYIKAEVEGAVLSDQDIAERIEKEKGIKVARRTVAKYREGLGFLPSSKRAKLLSGG